MTYEEEFKQWIDSCFQQTIPNSVVAFSFNLFEVAETNDVKFGIEMVGTASFDEDDSDWACDEVWGPEVRQTPIPKLFSGDDWEECLINVKSLLQSYIKSHSGTEKFKQGVGIGFVDGEIEVLWQP
ncbi:hypothetical protein [Undibacterium baiyunense]|uniref:Uncharacterized protein n=1 Tax=Undibacterium baiyunense TaxID=2828731 RepID=A0A941DCM3_9BURK|nr:hypothetical protein [Undibacterium baiyunense]MBR7746293.1 hypothetical protein [Undibacterium baiyunense]